MSGWPRGGIVRCILFVLFLSAAGGFAPQRAHAAGIFDLRGHGKYTLATYFYDDSAIAVTEGGTRQTLQAFNARLVSSYRKNRFSANADYDVSFAYTDNALLIPRDMDKDRLFNLSDTNKLSENYFLVHRLDRLNVAYTGEQIVIKAGRQAVSWGNGFLFQPMDVFNPFSPVAFDKDYKMGDDMLYGQWVTLSGNDVQFIFTPRRDEHNDLYEKTNTYAMKYHALTSQGDIDLLVARHYADEIFGVGFVRTIRSMLWRVDVIATHLPDDTWSTSVVTNADYSWIWFDRNIYGFLEYFHNGFGAEDFASAANANTLVTRIARGELYASMQNYLGGGLQIEVHPLVMLSPTMIYNLADGSGQIPVTLTYSWQQDLNLVVNVLYPFGDGDSEYGNRAAAGRSVTLLLAYYF